MTVRQIEGLVGRGEAQRLRAGVYLLGPIISPRTRDLAAVLACGRDAWLSHHSATLLYGMLRRPANPGPIDVTITGRHRGRQPGIRLHRTESLEPRDRHAYNGVPVTSPERTLIDLAGRRPLLLEAAVAEAFALGLTDRGQLLTATTIARGRRGVARLRTLLEATPARTRSGYERRVLKLVRDAGLPEPEVNATIVGWEVDLLWRNEGVVVEIDAYSTHSSPRAFERDRAKSADLEEHGLAVRRITPRQLDNPTLATARIRRALSRFPSQ